MRGRLPRPKILGLRPSTLVGLYLWRLRRHPVQELLAASGIAVGVALFFGVLVAATAINGSAAQLDNDLIGRATLQVAARSSEGFSERSAEAAGNLPGVRVASPVLRESAAIVGPGGRQIIQLIGVTPSLVQLKAGATRNLGAGSTLLSGGIGLPELVAKQIGVHGGERVTVISNGEAHSVVVRATLGSQTVGVVAESPIAIGLLPVIQRLTGKAGRVTNVLIEPQPDNEKLAARELEAFAAGKLDVYPAHHDLTLLAGAAAPINQSTTLFAAISAMVGFLLALNAMMLTVPERRRFIAELRTQGFDNFQVVLVLATQALILGIFASVAGIGLGDLLSHTLFNEVPSFLTFAFPVDARQVVTTGAILLALGCGVLAALLASLPPLADLRPSRSLDAVLREPGDQSQRIGRHTVLILGAVGAFLVGSVTTLVVIVPDLTVLGGVLLALAALCLVPSAFSLVHVFAPISERIRRSMIGLAVIELRATAARSIALAGVAALAVYGSVAIQGARRDLIGGLDSAITQYLDTADVWVTTGDNVFTTDSFNPQGAVAAIRRAPGVASVRSYYGGLLTIGPRRLWVRARPPDDPQMLQSSQLISGNIERATARIRQGGWAAVSNGFATEHHLHVGDTFLLPTPSGLVPMGVAAITTNTGWPSGAITLSAIDYRRFWQTAEPAALEITLKSGVTPMAGQRAIRSAIGNRPGLWVQTRAQREAQFEANARQALRSLGQIATLLLVAAALAIAFALSAALWQRRARFAALKAQGFEDFQLWRSLLFESTIVLAMGCADGLLLGLYGHALANRWLKMSTGFPAPFAVGWLQMLTTLGLVSGIALAVIALPGLTAARVPPRVSFQE